MHLRSSSASSPISSFCSAESISKFHGLQSKLLSRSFTCRDEAKFKRQQRNKRYRNSLNGIKRINVAKERYRAKFGQTLIKRASQLYRSTPIGRERCRSASYSYQRRPKGRKSYSAAAYSYQRRPKGRKSYSAAAYSYQRRPKGRESYSAAAYSYQRRAEGRKSYSAAAYSYQRRPKGRKVYNKANAAYYSSHKDSISQTRKRAYKKNHSFRYYKDNLDDFDFERHFDARRRVASERIRCHFTHMRSRAAFARFKTEILAARKSIYLPPLPKKRKGETKPIFSKSKKFFKSRSRLGFKLSAALILKNNMANDLVKDLEDLLYPNLPLKGKSLELKKSFFSTQLVDRVLAVRDLWIRCLYANTYKLSDVAESLLAKLALDPEDRGEAVKDDKILGWRCHTKGSEPYFPEYSFKDGNPYLFLDKTKDDSDTKSYHACNENCSRATTDEISKVIKILKSLTSLDVRQCRKAIQYADRCENEPQKLESIYRLIVTKRNHPEACHLPQTKCSSFLLLLRGLSVHYKGARELYKMANMMKIADQFVSDFDTAIAIGDIHYLLKLLAFKPPISSKNFHVDRPEEIINETTMISLYGNFFLEYWRKCQLLPKEVCISCFKLVRDDKKFCHTITERMSKPKDENSQYAKLLRYLQMPEWVNTGNDYVRTLIGKKMCNYCYNKMQKNEIPRTSVLNKMNTGKTPDEIKKLTQFERIFIRQVAMYQTVFKLDTSAGNLPYNERMAAIKGFSVHLPVPLQNTLQQLGDGRPGKLVDPRNFILLHGIPNKNRHVWQRLINVDNVFAALQWLVKHNPLYSNINLPENPIDLLPPDPTKDNEDNDHEEFLCESGLPEDDKVDSSSFGSSFSINESVKSQVENKNTSRASEDEYQSSSDDTSGLTEGDSDIVCLDNPEYIIANKKNKDPTEGVDNSLEDFLCESSDSIVLSSNSSIGETSLIKMDPTLGRNNESLEEFLCMSSQSGKIDEQTKYSQAGIRGGSRCSKMQPEEPSLYDLGEIEEDSLFRILWNEATPLDTNRLKLETKRCLKEDSDQLKRKYVTAVCIISLSKRILAHGLCCQVCAFRVKSTRRTTNIVIRDKTLPFLDLDILTATYCSLKQCLNNMESAVSLNSCGICNERKLKNSAPIQNISRKRSHKKNKSNPKSHTINEATGIVAAIKINSFNTLDELCQDGTICQSCYSKLDDSVQVKANHFFKPKTANITSLMKQTLMTRSHDRKIQALKVASNIARTKLGSQPGLCFKCKDSIKSSSNFVILSSLLPPKIHLKKTTLSLPKERETDFAETDADVVQENHVSCIDSKTKEMLVMKTSSIQSPCNSNTDRLKRLAVNMTHLRHLIANIKSIRQHKSHCGTCLPLIKETKRLYKRVIERKFTQEFPRLENMDPEVLYTLCLDSDKRLLDSCTIGLCFHCQKNLKSFAGLGDLKGGNGDSTDFDDIDELSQGLDEPMDVCDSSDHLSYVDEGEVKKDGTQKDDTKDTSCGVDQDETTKIRNLLEHMSEDDFKNLVEQYTVTGLENMKENPDLLDDLYQLLRLDDDPLDLDDSNLDLLAFPEIFCWGLGGKRGFRAEKGTNVQYEETRMLSSNPASRRHIQYLFHLAGENERRKITRSIFSTIKFVQGLGSVDSNSLLQMIKNKDPKLLRRMTRVLKDVPNTASYWNSQHAKLAAQIGKYGPPTFFATFSPSEYDWPELIEYLREVNSDLPNIDALTPSELMAKDPVLTSTFVHQRFNSLFDFILEAKPLGEVYSYFIRHEYQSRGTVHFHTLLWIKDAPLMGRNTDQEISSFIQKYVSCRLPDQLEEPVLYDIVTKYQTHSCRSYCLRKFKNRKFKIAKKEIACRFGFPRPLNKMFTLHDVLSSVIARRSKRMRKRLYDLPRTEEERYINDYNPTLSFLWRGNMDIQFIAENSYAICNYVTKYVTKAEKSSIDFLDFKDLSKSTFQNLSKFAYACLKSREMGSHEAADRLLQNHGQMWRSSESFLWIQTAPFNMRSRVMKNIKDLEGQRADSHDVFYPDLLHDFYPNRPRTDSFKIMSLYDFATKYDKVAGPPKEGERYIRIAKEDGTYIRTMITRTKTPVVYHNEYSVEKQPELFYYSMLCLYKPWRNEAEIMGSSESCEEEFFKAIEVYPQLKDMAEKKIDIQKARERMNQRADEKIEEENAAPVNSDGSACYEYDDINDTVIDPGLEDYEAVNSGSEIRTEGDLNAFVQTLNADQLRVYNRVTRYLEHRFDHDHEICDEEKCKSEPLFLYVSGFGGTGKSYLIKAIQGFMFVQSNIFQEKAGLMLTAPTGLAASNINGQTIHSALKLPVEHGATAKYSALRKKHLDQMRSVMEDLKAIIIDEISMVSSTTLMYINLRLQEVFGESSFFGGRCIIVFGDLLQLPPVKGQQVFEELAAKEVQTLTGGLAMSLNLWRFFEFDELRINQRQVGLNNSSWSQVLSRIRIGTHSPADMELLKSRLIKLPSLDQPSPKQYLTLLLREYDRIEKKDSSVVCLLPTVTMVNEFNRAIMDKRFPGAKLIKSIDSIDGRTKRVQRSAEAAVKRLDKLEDPRNTAGLEKALHLCKGMRVMLRRNVDVSKGLVNGSVGTILELHEKNGITERLTIHFEGLDDNLELCRDSRKIEIFPGAYLHRAQFPVSVAYGITIHKAQGLSLSTVIADLGRSIFECGQIYVALSRCKTLQGLYLINFAPQKITVNKPALTEYVRLGSKPVKDHKVFSDQQPKTKSMNKEIVWYTSNAAKKAKSTIEDNIKSSEGNKRKASDKSNPKNSLPTKKPTKSSDYRTGVNHPGTISASVLVDALIRENSDSRNQQLISRRNMEAVFTDIMIPFANGRLRQGSLLHEWASELNPDPLNTVSNIEDKWLSGSTLQKCVSCLQDLQLLSNGVSIYNLGAFARTSYLNAQRTRTVGHGYVSEILIPTFGEQRLTRNMLVC